jgi:hypothetical protein
MLHADPLNRPARAREWETRDSVDKNCSIGENSSYNEIHVTAVHSVASFDDMPRNGINIM